LLVSSPSWPGSQLSIDGAAIDALRLKRLIRFKAINDLLQGIEIPNRFPDGFPDRDVRVCLQEGSYGLGSDHRGLRDG
jgi:hypothetical protein